MTLPAVIGVNTHPYWADFNIGVLDKLQAAGIKHIRIDVAWKDLQPTATSYNTTLVAKGDAFMQAAAAKGIKVLVMLYWPPQWSSGTTNKNGLPANGSDYGNILAYVAARWGTTLSGIEMFNEMDTSTYSATKSPADFVKILKAAYPIAKRAVPGMAFIAGSPTYLGLANGWYRGCYAAGLKFGVTHDALGIHPYMSPGDVAPDGNTTGSARQWSIVGIADLKAQILVPNGDPSDLWATEFGWSSHTNEMYPTNQPWNFGVSAANQAAYLKTAYQMLADQGVKAAYWYADRNTSQSDVNQANFGVMNYDLSAKPAYTALAGLSVVSDPKDAQIISLSAQVVALTTQVDDLTTQLKTANDQLSTAEANLATAQLRINNALTALS